MLVACEQALHYLGESQEVTRDQHAKGNTSTSILVGRSREKDLTETGNRAGKISGTQGRVRGAGEKERACNDLS